MVKTIDKIVIGILAVLLVGMGGVFITAISSDTNEDIVSSNRQLLVTDVTPKEANFVVESNLEEDEDDETEVAISGNALDKASAAALAYIDEGRVTDSEIGDEEGYYEIEITLNNGEEVDVHLDESFKVISTEYEDEDEDD